MGLYQDMVNRARPGGVAINRAPKDFDVEELQAYGVPNRRHGTGSAPLPRNQWNDGRGLPILVECGEDR